MAGMNGGMNGAGQGFVLEAELFITLNEVEQRVGSGVNQRRWGRGLREARTEIVALSKL